MTDTQHIFEPVVAIVVAAGSGTRLGGGISKALRAVAGRTLVERSVALLAEGGCTHAIVVIAPSDEHAMRTTLATSPIPVLLVQGGRERQDSVRHGLDALAAQTEMADAEIVLVHDAARAFVPPEVVTRVVAAVRSGAEAVIPVVPVTDTVRELTEVGSVVVDRSILRAVQTPQGFDRQLLDEAHRLLVEAGHQVTDDAAACEYAGATVTLVQGDRRGFKVTEPLDLVLAEALVRGDD